MTPQEIHKQVMGLFTYQSDKETFGYTDYWSSFADSVEKNEPFKGDCDNFAMTCAEIAARNGHDKKNVMLALCWVNETNEYHAVCIIGSMLLDNRYSEPFDWTWAPYKWDKAMRLSEPSVWREINYTNKRNTKNGI